MRTGTRRSDYKNILKQENLSLNVLDLWKIDTKDKLLNLDRLIEDTYKIPPIVHVVYFTSIENPLPLKEIYIRKYLKSYDRLTSENSDFKFFFWTNHEQIIPNNMTELENFEIRNLDEFKSHDLSNYTNIFVEEGQSDPRKFVEASDLSRIMIQHKYGGIYYDLDYEIINASLVTPLMKSFNYFNGHEGGAGWTFGNAFIASSPNHPVILEAEKLILRNLDKNNNKPEYIKYPFHKFDQVIMQTGPILMTIASLKAMNQDGNIDIILPQKVIYHYKYVQALERKNATLPELNHIFEDIEIYTVGGDMFSASWGNANDKEYFTRIIYNETIFENNIESFSNITDGYLY